MMKPKLLLLCATILCCSSFIGLAGCSSKEKVGSSQADVQQPAIQEPQKQESPPAVPATVDKQGDPVVPNPLDILVLVNKKRHLTSDYVPPDLVEPQIPFSFTGNSPKKTMRQEAARDIEKLFNAAKTDGIDLVAQSGYRSYTTQKQIYTEAYKQQGEQANQYSAQPGQSEHQTGLAMDVTSHAMGFQLEPSFADTKEGKWLAQNAAAYGFIIRYPKGKESITGYSYEPWHIRYVGVKIAQDLSAKGLTLEEYFSK